MDLKIKAWERLHRPVITALRSQRLGRGGIELEASLG